jgi:myo-inositol catabolism protein IolC
MSKVIVDETLWSRLNGLTDGIEFCDETGKTLGYFVPAAKYEEMVFAWLNAQITDEELIQASQETGGSTLAEIWQRLGRTD